MFNQVLIGYDGSDGAEDALALARLLAVVGPGRLTATCTYWYEPMSARVGKSGIGPGEMRAEAEAVLAPLRQRLGDEIDLRPVGATSPAKSLTELAESIGADLIVVGSTARGPIGRALAGTTAERLLHGGPCAVAVAPRGFREAEHPELRRIGVAYCTDPDSRAALTVAREIARATHALLDVITVFDQQSYKHIRLDPDGLRDYIASVRASLTADLDDALESLGSGVPMRPELVDGTPEEVLVERAAELDLLIMGSRSYGPLRRVLLGSVSHVVLQQSPCPVLVVPRAATGRFEAETATSAAPRAAIPS